MRVLRYGLPQAPPTIPPFSWALQGRLCLKPPPPEEVILLGWRSLADPMAALSSLWVREEYNYYSMVLLNEGPSYGLCFTCSLEPKLGQILKERSSRGHGGTLETLLIIW